MQLTQVVCTLLPNGDKINLDVSVKDNYKQLKNTGTSDSLTDHYANIKMITHIEP